MRTAIPFATLSGFLLTVLSANAQGTFQNLNFESATLSPIPAGQFGGSVSIFSALPHWTGYLGSVQQTQVLQNDYDLGSAAIDILGPSWSSPYPGIIDGNYTVMLQAGAGPGGLVDASIAQNGTVPAIAQSVQFSIAEVLGGSGFSVFFAGNSLSPVLLYSAVASSGQSYNVYGVDISAYAGQTGKLEFTSIANGRDSSLLLDDISFSTNVMAVPEPNTLALILMGGLALAARRWRAKGS
jgi:hypothetical protein